MLGLVGHIVCRNRSSLLPCKNSHRQFVNKCVHMFPKKHLTQVAGFGPRVTVYQALSWAMEGLCLRELEHNTFYSPLIF